MKNQSLARPFAELSLASIFWGFGFIGTVWALQFIGFSAVVFYRFFIAFIVGLIILLWKKTSKAILINELIHSMWPGLFLSLCLVMQTWGLMTVSAAKSSFITILYVVIVPVFAWLWGQEKLNPLHWLSVALALLGTALIVDLQWSAWTMGDSLTLANAFLAAVHILSIDHYAKKSKDNFAFNVFQGFWTALFALSFAGIDPRWDLTTMNMDGWIGLLSLSFGSSLIAFYLQIRAQRVLSPSIASILFLLESPTTLVFAYFLLNEKFNQSQMVGASLIIIACLSAIFMQSKNLTKKL